MSRPGRPGTAGPASPRSCPRTCSASTTGSVPSTRWAPRCCGTAGARAVTCPSTRSIWRASGPRRRMRCSGARNAAGSWSAPSWAHDRGGTRQKEGGPVTARRLLIEADGGSRGNPGTAGYGAVVRDAVTGEVLGERSEAIGRATNNVAEYSGLLAGLRAAGRLAPGAAAEVRMDSRLVVEQMSGRWRIKHPDLQALAAEARLAARALGRVTYTWVPRERNTHADRLANQAMDSAAERGGSANGSDPGRRSGTAGLW